MFLEYANKLRQNVPALAPEQAEDMIQSAWRDICDADDEWSFLHRTETWLAPAIITLTGVGVTDNDATVTLPAAAVAALAGLNNPALTVRQFRVGQSGGPVYSIASSDLLQVTDGVMNSGFGTLTSATGSFSSGDVGKVIVVAGAGVAGANLSTTISGYTSPTQVTLAASASTTVGAATVSWGSYLELDRPYRETTNASATASVFRSLYQPLSVDFARMDCLVDNTVGYEFGYEIGTPDEINVIDPQRAAYGFPFRVYFHSYDATTGLPIYELWPAPSAERAYEVNYWTRGGEFLSDDSTLPPSIPEELLLLRARMLAYEWGMTSHPDWRQRASYATALQYVRSKYSTEGQLGRPLGMLEIARRKDHSFYRKTFIRRTRRLPMGYPIDSNFMQSHAYGPFIGGL